MSCSHIKHCYRLQHLYIGREIASKSNLDPNCLGRVHNRSGSQTEHIFNIDL